MCISLRRNPEKIAARAKTWKAAEAKIAKIPANRQPHMWRFGRGPHHPVIVYELKRPFNLKRR